jgi:hypothetical protein
LLGCSWKAAWRAGGQLIEGADLFIVAMALVDDMMLVTHKRDQRVHPCKKLRFEYIGQGESQEINGLCSPEHQRFRCVLSDFCYCILLKKHGFKSKPSISVRMRLLVHDDGDDAEGFRHSRGTQA